MILATIQHCASPPEKKYSRVWARTMDNSAQCFMLRFSTFCGNKSNKSISRKVVRQERESVGGQWRKVLWVQGYLIEAQDWNSRRLIEGNNTNRCIHTVTTRLPSCWNTVETSIKQRQNIDIVSVIVLSTSFLKTAVFFSDWDYKIIIAIT